MQQQQNSQLPAPGSLRNSFLLLLAVALFCFAAFFLTTTLYSKPQDPIALGDDEDIEVTEKPLSETKVSLIQQMFNKFGKKGVKELISPSQNIPPKPTEEKPTKSSSYKGRRSAFVTIATHKDMTLLQAFIGSIQSKYTPASEFRNSEGLEKDDDLNKVITVIYGLNLRPADINIIKLWKNVEYVDLFDEFLKSHLVGKQLGSDEGRGINTAEFWRPTAIRHALLQHEKVLYVDVHLILSDSIDSIERIIDQRGSYFVTKRGMSDGYIFQESAGCDPRIQGYTLKGFAQEQYLVPLVKCSRRVCSQTELGVLGDQAHQDALLNSEDRKKALTCTSVGETLFHEYSEGGDLDKRCNIVHRDDILFTPTQLPAMKLREIAEKRKGADSKTRIALLVPITSIGIQSPSVDKFAFISLFVPSLVKTITEEEKQQFTYKIYLGFDAYDVYFDNDENQKKFYSKVKEMIGNLPIEMEMFRLMNSKGWVVFLWNALSYHAFENGEDYLFQLNDDIEHQTPGWTTKLVANLKNNPVRSNLGATGPRDPRHDRELYTQAMVHRTHIEIFGNFYPTVFENWYSDDWITSVYTNEKSSFLQRDVFIANKQTQGTRYSPCKNHGSLLQIALESGRNTLKKWLAEHPLPVKSQLPH